jgi:cytochrome P450
LKKQKLLALGLVATVAVVSTLSCTTSPKKQTAAESAANSDFASTSSNQAVRDPASPPDNGFFQEYNAISGLGRIPLLKKHLLVVFKWVRQKPIPFFQEMRARAPVFTFETIPIKNAAHPNVDTVLVSKNVDVKEILDHPEIFSVADYTRKMDESVGPYMLSYDHKRINDVEKPWMRQLLKKDDLPAVRQMVKELTAKALADGTWVGTKPDGTPFARLEMVNAIGRKVPVGLTGRYFGFPGPSDAKMYEWSHATQDDYFHNVKNVSEVHVLAVRAAKEMHAYLKKLMATKRDQIAKGTAGDDILTRMLILGKKEGYTPEQFDDLVRRNIIGTLVGGIETTQAAVVQTLRQLLLHPDWFAGARQAALDGNDALLSKYVWEALRFDPVNPFVVRMAEKDYTLRGNLIKKGSLVLVATQSAMFDEEVVGADAGKFSLNRDPSVYFHLGYGHHRCLGDYISEVQVPEILKAILVKPGLRLASGQAGEIVKTPETASFPESFVVEYDAKGMPPSPIMASVDPAFAFEAYLQDFDRHEFRSCMSGTSNTFINIVKNTWRHFNVNFRQSLLWCRLKPAVRDCLERSQKTRDFDILVPSANHMAAVKACGKEYGMTTPEFDFYQEVFLGRSLDLSKMSTEQANRGTTGYDFEDRIRFYNRFKYRECFMNPKGSSSFKDDGDMIFYARLPIVFRMCIGIPVIENEMSHGYFGVPREKQFQVCKNGVVNKDSGALEGSLSVEERYYYRTRILKQDVSYSQVAQEEQAHD